MVMQLQVVIIADTWKIQLSGRNLENTLPKVCEAVKIPVMKPNAAALLDGSTASA